MSNSKLHLLAASDMKVRPDGSLDLSPSNVDVRASQEIPSNLRSGTRDKSMKMSLPMKRDMSEFAHKNESKTSRNCDMNHLVKQIGSSISIGAGTVEFQRLNANDTPNMIKLPNILNCSTSSVDQQTSSVNINDTKSLGSSTKI